MSQAEGYLEAIEPSRKMVNENEGGLNSLARSNGVKGICFIDFDVVG